MKKNIILIGAILIVIFMGMLVASRFYAFNNQLDNDNHYYNDIYEDELNYEFSIMHLSELEKNELELEFVQGVISLDLQDKTDLEALALINELKTQVASNVDVEPTYQRYQGMMGRRSTYNTYGNCHQSYYDSSFEYEWYYMHASDEDRDIMTLNLVNIIQATDFSNLSDEEKLSQLDDIKTQVMAEIDA